MEFHPYFTHKKWVRLGQNESNRNKRKSPGNSVFPGLSGTFLNRPIPMQASCWAALGDCKQSLSLVGHSSVLPKLALGESIENNPISQSSAKSVKSRGSDC